MKRAWILAALLAAAVVVLAVAPFVGMTRIPLTALWGESDHPVLVDVLWKLRMPRVVMGFLAGAGLATAGMAFQAMFRNPLATPFTLGVASGASLGSALAFHLGLTACWLGVSGVTLCAFGGALTTIALVYGLTRSRQGFSTATMLLAGVALSFSFSSLILFLQYRSDFTQTYRMLRWVMGGLDRAVSFADVLGVLPPVAAGSLVIFYLTHELNLITTGEQLAASRGVEVDRTKKILFMAASLMVGAVVAVCGPIGFVGLMAPHICRLAVGPDHRFLAPASWLFGGLFLVVCDAAARTIMAPAELPVGILTSLLGGPFFLCLLLCTSARREVA
ncbi:MAG: iron ABC transporter permease [Pirellulales bacterium]|nr:iron ABC transporter permease [Pirellulales bacterium]